MSRWRKDEIQSFEKFSRVGGNRFLQSSSVKFGLVLRLEIDRPCVGVEIKVE